MIPLAQNPPTKFKKIKPSYGWPKFAPKGQIMPFLKSFELGQKLGF